MSSRGKAEASLGKALNDRPRGVAYRRPQVSSYLLRILPEWEARTGPGKQGGSPHPILTCPLVSKGHPVVSGTAYTQEVADWPVFQKLSNFAVGEPKWAKTSNLQACPEIQKIFSIQNKTRYERNRTHPGWGLWLILFKEEQICFISEMGIHVWKSAWSSSRVARAVLRKRRAWAIQIVMS